VVLIEPRGELKEHRMPAAIVSRFVRGAWLGAAAALFASAAGAASAPKPSALVTLVAQTGVVTDCPDGGFGFAQQQPAGSFSAFAIPPKKVLVVTSIDWQTSGVMADRLVTATITSQATGTPSLVIARSSVRSDGLASAGGTLVVPSGVAVASGRTVCLEADGLPFAVLHGYLAKDK
jgi:hypothetical protein